MDSDDIVDDNKDENEETGQNMNDEYNYVAKENTGCQEDDTKEEKVPAALLDFGDDCEVESEKLQKDRFGGEKMDAVDANNSSDDECDNNPAKNAKLEEKDASDSSEDESDNIHGKGTAGEEKEASDSSEDEGDMIPKKGTKEDSDASNSSSSDEEAEHVVREPTERKASSSYSTSDDEVKEHDSEEGGNSDNEDTGIKAQDAQDKPLISKDGDSASSSDEEEEKDINEEKQGDVPQDDVTKGGMEKSDNKVAGMEKEDQGESVKNGAVIEMGIDGEENNLENNKPDECVPNMTPEGVEVAELKMEEDILDTREVANFCAKEDVRTQMVSG